MKTDEEQILTEAIEIAISQPELSQQAMIDIVQESTGVSTEIAEKSIIQSTKTIQQENKTDITEQSKKISYAPLIFIAINLFLVIMVLNFVLPMMIGDRSVMDVLQNTQEEPR